MPSGIIPCNRKTSLLCCVTHKGVSFNKGWLVGTVQVNASPPMSRDPLVTDASLASLSAACLPSMPEMLAWILLGAGQVKPEGLH